MAKSFLNVYRNGSNTIRHRYVEDGVAKEEEVHFKPFLGVHAGKNEKTSWTDLYGKPVKVKVFESMKAASEFKKENRDVLSILGDIKEDVMFIATQYREDIPLQTEGIIVWNIDIETPKEKGFPKPDTVPAEIVSISIHDLFKDTYMVFGLGDFTTTDEKITYMKMNSEKELLMAYIEYFNHIKPHFFTGWYVDEFDIPYIVNRTNKILGPEAVKKLSIEREVKKHESTNDKGQVVTTYTLKGTVIWDYLHLYKKYIGEPREEWSLGFIGKKEKVTEGKVDYEEYGSLWNLYKQNYQLFIEYMIQDTRIVKLLNDKLSFFNLALSIMWEAKCTPDAIFGTVQAWDSLIYNELLKRKILCPPNKRHAKERYAGGYVGIPKPNLYRWVEVCDIVSSYPNQIRSFNISPETIIPFESLPNELQKIAKTFKFYLDPTDDRSLDRCPTADVEAMDFLPPILQKYNVCFTANGQFFKREVEGVLPSIFTKVFLKRVRVKKIAGEKKATKAPDYMQYHLAQYALKILLNSGYGALANEFSRYFDIRIAEAITTNGQTCCRGITQHIVKNIPDITAFYGDTDSVFMDLSSIIESRFGTLDLDTQTALDFILKLHDKMIQPVIEEFLHKLAVNMNMRELTIEMEPECVADAAIFTAKKHYVMNKIWDEGKNLVSSPELKIRGIEIVRTSTPQIVRDWLKKTLDIIFKTASNDKLIEYIQEKKEDFTKLPFEAVASPRAVNFSDYTLSSKSLPIQVRAALVYNQTIKINSLQDNCPEIYDGDKIKFSYIRVPNIVGSNVIGCGSDLPKEISQLVQIDYEKQFSKTFLAPLEKIVTAIGWEIEKRNTLEDFFS